MKRRRFNELTLLGITVLLLINACVAATPAPTATVTTIPTNTQIPPTITPTVASGAYKNDEFGVSFTYPTDWNMLESADGPVIVIGNGELSLKTLYNAVGSGEARIIISMASLERQSYGSPIAALEQYTLFSDLDMPDKELAHVVEINGREFAIGTYSEAYIKSRQSEIPLFIAMHFTRFNTITVEMYGTPAEEAELRTTFEDFVGSIDGIQSTRFSSYIPFDPTALLAIDDVEGWVEPKNNQTVLSDGLCRQLQHGTLENYTMTNCTFVGWEFSTLNSMIDEYKAASNNAFLELDSKYTYKYESNVYGYRNEDGFPSYILKLDNTDILVDGSSTYYMLGITTSQFQSDTNFEDGLRKQFSEEIDSLLHDVMTKVLAKVK